MDTPNKSLHNKQEVKQEERSRQETLIQSIWK